MSEHQQVEAIARALLDVPYAQALAEWQAGELKGTVSGEAFGSLLALSVRLAQAEQERDDAIRGRDDLPMAHNILAQLKTAEVRLREYEEAASDALGRLDMLADNVREHRCEACTDDVAEARAALSRVAASGGREAPKEETPDE